MFPMNLLRRLGRDKVPTKDEASRTRRVRARRYLGGLEPLEQRQLLAVYMLVGDGTVVKGDATNPAAPKGAFAVSTWVWNIPPPIIVHPNPDGGAGGPMLPTPTLTITKMEGGPASGALLHAYLTGESFKSAEVVVIPPGGTGKFVEFDLANVVLTSFQLSGKSTK